MTASSNPEPERNPFLGEEPWRRHLREMAQIEKSGEELRIAALEKRALDAEAALGKAREDLALATAARDRYAAEAHAAEDFARQMQDRVERLVVGAGKAQAALRKYGAHFPSCTASMQYAAGCPCGFADAMAPSPGALPAEAREEPILVAFDEEALDRRCPFEDGWPETDEEIDAFEKTHGPFPPLSEATVEKLTARALARLAKADPPAPAGPCDCEVYQDCPKCRTTAPAGTGAAAWEPGRRVRVKTDPKFRTLGGKRGVVLDRECDSGVLAIRLDFERPPGCSFVLVDEVEADRDPPPCVCVFALGGRSVPCPAHPKPDELEPASPGKGGTPDGSCPNCGAILPVTSHDTTWGTSTYGRCPGCGTRGGAG